MTHQATTPTANIEPQTEHTAIGEQFVVQGYQPVSQKERLDHQARLPMQPKRRCVQKPCDVGLFDEIRRNQLDLF
ncbi:hypothetical protein [uncultured Hoeflea sp.]|uniref:hypothetical protein n=1 Tax=uncultured Hoeflea sp. TaxID=538666 RepID=UPI00263333E4|nr:hypothetical protein [uncultured Hoeflea sp.]